MIPEPIIIILALVSTVSGWRYFGGKEKALARLWIAGFYLYLWITPDRVDPQSVMFLAALSRVGIVLIFVTEIIPVIVMRIRGKKPDEL